MAKLALNALPISMFAFDKASNMLIGEMSMVERNIGRLYDDACDVGIEIKGKNHTVRYVQTGLIRDRHEKAETAVFVFGPCYEDTRRIKNLPVLHVLNT